MKEFTVDNMIAACKWLPDMDERRKLADSFQTMRFHNFISEELLESFWDAWRHEFYFEVVKTGQLIDEDELKDIFRVNSFVTFNERDFENWKSDGINRGIIKQA